MSSVCLSFKPEWKSQFGKMFFYFSTTPLILLTVHQVLQTERLQVSESKFKLRTPDTFDADLCQVLVYTDQNQGGKIAEVSCLGTERLCDVHKPSATAEQ